MQIKNYLPVLEWLPNYKRSNLQGDLSAGLTVGVMLIPQGMAYAMIAGLPPIYGLYASTIPLLIYALLGTSRQLAVGPVAMVSLLTAAGIGTLAEGGTETYIMLAITLALFVGAIQFLLGAFRLGFLVNFLSHPVISGFTSAAALIIGLSQLKHLLGVDIARSHHVHEILLQAIEKASDINWATFAVGIGGILLIKGVKKINKAIPGPLLAVVFGILAVYGLGLTEQGVKIVGTVPDGLPSFVIPSFSGADFSALLPIALTIALVSFMESIAVAKAIQAKHKDYKVSANQELIGLGAANIVGSFFQSYPTTGGFSRTAVNDQAGAKTGLAAIISALLIGLTLLFLTPLFYYLPKAILASVIMVAVFGLIDIKEARHLWATDRADFWMLIATFIGTLSLGIEQGILIGVALSLGVVIFRTTLPHFAVLGKIPGEAHFKNINRFDNLEQRDDVLIMRFDARLYFANVNFFKEAIEAEVEKRKDSLKLFILDANSINSIDSSGVHALEELADELKAQGIEFYMTSVKGPLRDTLRKAHFSEKLGEGNFFMHIQTAIDKFDQKDPQRFEKYVLQTNHA
ncbi:SulP family inorganic anion transporter [Phaeodactylibacter luteus]|uniref:Solute carrier 26 family protein n=1 Tax=Phaeodactylibacter luteus TaxID=1564516 RepID=A0A5C6RLX6_9BACT|nr:solute carrier family 26 protein [Phaeodactylibacter luteus]TXB62630.1 solute carrier 26 family protein [Phaeodactylibacter luteus]